MQPSTKSMDSQKHMETWLQESVLLNAKLHKNQIVTMMNPAFVSCNYEEHSAVISYPVAEWEMNPQGTMHGGLTVTAFDTAFGILCRYYTRPKMITTVSLQTTYLKPVWPGSTLIVSVKTTLLGSRLINVTGEAWTDKDPNTLVATATASFYVLQNEYPLGNLPE